jgi:anti-anti-sigma regulatory factor
LGAALGALVSALSRSRELAGQVHLIVQEPQIIRLLTITGLNDQFALYENRAGLQRAKAEQ